MSLAHAKPNAHQLRCLAPYLLRAPAARELPADKRVDTHRIHAYAVRVLKEMCELTPCNRLCEEVT